MPRKYKKIGYTPCQLEIAEWINLGHDKMREDHLLRCYACTGKGESSNFPWVKYLMYNGHDLGNGEVQLYGDPNKTLNKGDRYIDQVRHSHVCGLVIYVDHMILRKKSLQRLAAS